MENKAVFDFDKTLIRINTFPFWIVFVIVYSIFKIDFKSEFLQLLWKRKVLKSISHNQFKEELIKVDLDQSYHVVFAKLIANFKNKKCINRLNQLVDQKYKIAISSAAPAHYLVVTINLLFPNNKFVIIGAKRVKGLFLGNFKNEKVSNLINEGFIEVDEQIACLFTDSFDDAALAQYSKKLVLVSTDQRTRVKFKENFDREIEEI